MSNLITTKTCIRKIERKLYEEIGKAYLENRPINMERFSDSLVEIISDQIEKVGTEAWDKGRADLIEYEDARKEGE